MYQTSHHSFQGGPSSAHMPLTQGKPDADKCARRCCWTPYKCAKDRQCDCHKEK